MTAITRTEAIPSQAMDLAAYRKVIEQTSYWPGWEFTVYQDEWLGPSMLIVSRQPDRDNPARTTDLGVKVHIPPAETSLQFLRWLAWRLCEMAVHEVREGLRYRGTLIFDPHAREEG